MLRFSPDDVSSTLTFIITCVCVCVCVCSDTVPSAWLCRRGNTTTPQPSCLHFVYSSHSTASPPLVFLPVLRMWLGGVGKGTAHCAPLNRYCSSLILIDAQELSIIALRYDRRAEREKGVVRTDTRDKFRRIASAQWLPSLDCKHDPAWYVHNSA